MNEFLEQFLVESRDLIEQATEGLLLLERSPANAETLDAVFRAFHTLKGGAGIVDFAAMERAVHAAEDVLSDARASKRVLTPALVGDCLACLDQVVQWLDALEASGELPALGEEQADRIVARFHAPAPFPSDLGWVEALLARNPAARSRARIAIRFAPDAECFFHGEDPVARILSLPQLLALDLEPQAPWGDLSTLDPYRCNLVLSALAACTQDEASAHLKGHSGTCEFRPIILPAPEEATSSLPPRARDILKAQVALVGGTGAKTLAGRIASAGRAAANVLRSCGRIGHAELLTAATEKSLSQGTSAALLAALEEALTTRAATTVPEAVASQGQAMAISTVRVDAERIDALVRLTGELTVAKNAVGHVLKLAQSQDNPLAGALKASHVALERLVGELQGSVLAIRVLPLRTVLQRFPRVLRDLSAALGKRVELLIEGEDTEADKAIVEMLFEPLLHVLRNALDHGIETAEVRANRRKPAIATIRIRALHQADKVLVEVSDDGGGIDVDRVRALALDRGLVDAEALSHMSEPEIVDLVFAAGFSTADRVSALSGRGVGMDAVRVAVEKVGGRVSIGSRSGLGTTVRFVLPFSVMMTQVMTVESGSQLFGIPLDAVVETIRVTVDAIAPIGAAHAIVLRNRTVPVMDLSAVLGMPRVAAGDADVTLVIVSAAGQHSAIRVDRIGERLQVMLKPLEGLLAATPGLSGTTLLGDGRVLLVLDIAGLLS